MSKYLFDTHTLLWTLYEPTRLSAAVRAAIEEPANDLYVSHAAVWEIVDKAAKFRLPMAGFSVERIVERIDGLQATIVPIKMEDILASVKLPKIHETQWIAC